MSDLFLPDTFAFEAHGVTMTCERVSLPRVVAYRVVFSSKRDPIVITQAKSPDNSKFWTSIPEGRQQEAEGVGKLIDEYLKTNRS
ncbi:hypothetical protein ACTJIJ_14950 [Niabella sp. 22666]|uniref:hypothetical protein n=1 Tax=Niabella sp. 22666 TaxID=3453954 RepID=UPI003F825D92